MRLRLRRRADLRGLQDRPLVPRADQAHRRDREQGAQRSACRPTPGELPAAEVHGLLGRAASPCSPGSREAEVTQAPPGARRASRLQAHRHLRGGVRLAHRLHVLDLRAALRGRAGGRGAALRPPEDRHPRRRAEPHRPGHRVRLLLLPRLLRAARRGLRDHHGQLQPGDRLDRLRHLGPALFRAADGRGRARDPAEGEGERHAAWASSCSSAARRR